MSSPRAGACNYGRHAREVNHSTISSGNGMSAGTEGITIIKADIQAGHR